MITAKEARALVAAKEEIAAKLTELSSAITEAAQAGLLFTEYAIQDQVIAQQLLAVVSDLGYSARVDSNRQLLILKWQ